MIKALKELSFGSLTALFAFSFLMFSFQYNFSGPVATTHAQFGSFGSFGGGSSSGSGSGGSSSGGSSGASEYTAVAIGGKTEGVSDDTTCCNGVVLKFSSVNPASPWILDGEAIFVPLISESYDHGNEYSEGYNVLGTVRPGLCFLPDDYCESFEYIHEIGVIGTAEGE